MKKQSNLPLLFYPATGKVISEPYGTVLVLSSWNFPICKSLDLESLSFLKYLNRVNIVLFIVCGQLCLWTQ